MHERLQSQFQLPPQRSWARQQTDETLDKTASTTYIWDETYLRNAIQNVLQQQGELMETCRDPDLPF